MFSDYDTKTENSVIEITGFDRNQIKGILKVKDDKCQLTNFILYSTQKPGKILEFLNKFEKVINQENLKRKMEDLIRKSKDEFNEYESMKKNRTNNISGQLDDFKNLVNDKKYSSTRLLLELTCKIYILQDHYEKIIRIYQEIEKKNLETLKNINSTKIYFDRLEEEIIISGKIKNYNDRNIEKSIN